MKGMLHGICLLLCAAIAYGRSAAASGRAAAVLPAVTNSLVNFGKLDIAFYVNSEPRDLRSNRAGLYPSSDAVEEPCSCSDMRSLERLTHSRPADLLSDLFGNKNIFSNRKPIFSTSCCNSHEQHVQEDSVIFEFGSKLRPWQEQRGREEGTSLLSVQRASSPSPRERKLVELLIFPKRTEVASDVRKIIQKNSINKDELKVVGDKKIRNDFKSLKIIPPLQSSSVKKDLTAERQVSAAGHGDAQPMQTTADTGLA